MPLQGTEERSLAIAFVGNSDTHKGNMGFRGPGPILEALMVDFNLSFSEYYGGELEYSEDNIHHVFRIIKYMHEKQPALPVFIDQLFNNIEQYIPTSEIKKMHDYRKEIDAFIVMRCKKNLSTFELLSLYHNISNTPDSPKMHEWVDKINGMDGIDKIYLLLAKQPKWVEHSKNRPDILGKPLVKTFKDNNMQAFDQLLEILKDHPEALKPAFLQALSWYHRRDTAKAQFAKILPHLKDHPNLLQEALLETIAKGEMGAFDQLLEMLKDQPEALKPAFLKAIWYHWSDTAKAQFTKILPHLKDHPNLLQEALLKTIDTGAIELFDQLLEMLKNHPEALKPAFLKAISWYDCSDPARAQFAKLLPHLKDRPNILQEALLETIGKSAMMGAFDQLLEVLKNQPEALKPAFLKALCYHWSDAAKAQFATLLPHLKDHPHILQEALVLANTSNESNFKLHFIAQLTEQLSAALAQEAKEAQPSTAEYDILQYFWYFWRTITGEVEKDSGTTEAGLPGIDSATGYPHIPVDDQVSAHPDPAID